MQRDHRVTPAILPSAGLLVLRVVVGITFLVHGLDKLGDLTAAEQFFASLDIPAPDLMAPFVAVTETVGGVLLLGCASIGIGIAGAGRFSLDASLELPERVLRRASSVIG